MSARSEADLIAAVSEPATVASLSGDLTRLGLGAGAVVIVHSSMAALGWVAGGAQAVVEALLATVGSTGTVVMPSQSAHLSDPARWSNPPVPAAWVATIRAEMPAYDLALTPTRGMGQVVECFRHHPRTLRSGHPTLSFVANGPDAVRIVGEHPLTPGFGETSPLARLYDLDAVVLLLGVGHANNTSLHLAEHRASWPGKHSCAEGVPVRVDGERRWLTYDDLDHDDSDFVVIGDAFAAAGDERTGRVAAATARLFAVRALVDHATTWMTTHRR